MIIDLEQAARRGPAVVGTKAAVLSELAGAGFAVPAGFVVTTDAVEGTDLAAAAARLGDGRFAVRSSGAAEDLPDASYAGLYETFLDVPADELGNAVRACFAAADSDRVHAYHQRRGGPEPTMAVLVQRMIDPLAAGVAFTAHPVTGNRNLTVVTAVPGPGEALVSGRGDAEEWLIEAGAAPPGRSRPDAEPVLTTTQALAVAALARRVADRYGRPQDVEWAIDHDGRLWLLQARPMTALPAPVSWDPPGPGLWMRNFRLGEWLPEPVTPLFATWLLPLIENGYLDGMQHSVRVRVPFRWTLVNGWYYNATPIPSLTLLATVLRQGRAHAVKVLFNALVRVGRNPAAADRAVLADLERQWREQQLPAYRHLVDAAEAEIPTAPPDRLIQLVDQLGRQAGVALWYLAIVGGSAWKMEACLTRFTRAHLAKVLPSAEGGAQPLLRGLPGAEPTVDPHAVFSADWYHPLAADLPAPAHSQRLGDRHAELVAERLAAEQRCTAALADRPRLLAEFQQLLRVNQHYAVTREQQARTFTLAWPALRACARSLGRHLKQAGALDDIDDVFFCTRSDLDSAGTAIDTTGRRARWEQQRRFAAPLTLGRPPRPFGDVIDHAVQTARGGTAIANDSTIVGHPASAGQATGPVRIITAPADFATFADGAILVAKATAPAWTPLFAHAAAIVTDGGTLAAHASLVAREYGIPAVVGTGDATTRLHPGDVVTVNGTTGTVTIHRQ
ncbi:PEP/pyruvate-binding domain-containing protein [Paractinoplanes rhizophilus]|uniref:PEP/pyruvate-binding domain-containing protein n=1 Tax=Paractinoplanes rhizophilus TaxID=1416877 RepID=A0ABW2HXS8_9ACTN